MCCWHTQELWEEKFLSDGGKPHAMAWDDKMETLLQGSFEEESVHSANASKLRHITT